MGIEKGNISVEKQFSVISDMKSEKEHRELQGYCTAPDGSHLFAMLKATSQNNNANQDTSAKLVSVSYSDVDISSTKNYLYHANDCTYTQGSYFVITAKNKKIYEFNKSTLNKKHEYNYKDDFLSTITSIAYIGNNHFLLGSGYKIAVCKKILTV